MIWKASEDSLHISNPPALPCKPVEWPLVPTTQKQKTPEPNSGVLPHPHKNYSPAPWHFLYFLPLPHGQGSLRPTFSPRTTCCTPSGCPAPARRACSSSRSLRRW